MDAIGRCIAPIDLACHDGLGPDDFDRVWALLSLGLFYTALPDLVALIW